MIKRWMGSAAVLPAVLATSAFAAPPAPVYNWTGFYVGANAGGTWGQFGSNLGVDCSNPNSPPAYFCWLGFPGNAPLLGSASYGTINASGFTGGVQAGYNWQTGNIVAGIESDFGAFHLRATRVYNGTFVDLWGGTNFTLTNSASTDWLFTFRGRLGFTMLPNLLGYVTGGLAVTRIGTSTSYSDNNTGIGPVSGSFNDAGTKLGYVIGGGAEYALPSNWSVKAEYLYLGFGNVSAAGVVTTTDGAYRQALSTLRDLTAHVARVGINRRF